MKESAYKKKAHKHFWQRMQWYAFGFILFYAPFALYSRGMAFILGKTYDADIHDTCFRIPIQRILSGTWVEFFSVWGMSLFLLIISAVIFGPFFCGKLCPAGGLSELLSRYVPKRLKIDWTKYVDPVPLRFGFLAGFVIAPSVTGSLNCAYCNYTFLEKMLNAGFWAEMVMVSSTAILTAVLWLLVFGVFTKGGRGYCNFLCPVGAVQSFFHFLGRKLPWTYKLKLATNNCNNCGKCVEECPMGSLEKIKEEKAIVYNVLHCITCEQCTHACPEEALSYGRGDHGFVSKPSNILSPVTEKPIAETGD